VNEPTHLDLFSGLGGFAIAAQAAGFQTVAFCEKDRRCREFLIRTWGLPVHDDIDTLDGRQYRGVALVSGGPPCQPASRAGKQGGESDDRWKWPAAIRVLFESEADAFVYENPLGILDLAEYGESPPVGSDGFALGDHGDIFTRTGSGKLLEIVGQIEAGGYEVQPIAIPACAVNSPQLRMRIWIVGFRSDRGRRIIGSLADANNGCGSQSHEEIRPGRDAAQYAGQSNFVADAEREGHEKRGGQSRVRRGAKRRDARPDVELGGSADVASADGDRSNARGESGDGRGQKSARREGRDQSHRRGSESELADAEHGRLGAERETAEPRDQDGRLHQRSDTGNVADPAGSPRPEQFRESRERPRRKSPAPDPAESERPDGELADAEEQHGRGRETTAEGEGWPPFDGWWGDSVLADPECLRRLWRSQRPLDAEGRGWFDETLDAVTRLCWEPYEWTLCSDDKVRRTPVELECLDHGVHRSILAALGNAVVPQLVFRLLLVIRNLIHR
jgi:site-specific DNA-cytosine methylase